MTDLSFNILVALKDEELHGYALVKRLQALEGRSRLRTGTVYAALARLQQAGWVTEVETPADEGDARRRYYRVTPGGLEVARAEAARLLDVLGMARRKDIIVGPTGG